MLVTELGSVSEVNEVHPENALSVICVALLGILIEDKALQFEKPPRYFNSPRIDTVFNDVHEEKALDFISVVLAGIVTSCMELQP